MNISKRIVLPSAFVITALVGVTGGSALNALQASAATTTTAATASTTDPIDTPDTNTPKDESKGGHVGANGTKEVLLTGDAATKAKAAAEAAVLGGTVQRVENDAEGATYEAHMTKADGSHVTVKMDADFKVTSVDTGTGGVRPSNN